MERIKLLVILIVINVFKCSTMTINEIEDFKNFLKRTSQLDQNLKKGADTDSDDNDEADFVSDHAWEESGKFEGDLILNDRQRRLIVENVAEGLSRNGLKDGTKRWPNNEVIYYIQREHFNLDQVQAIEDGIEDLAQSSCVTFRPYKKGDRDAVVIQGSRKGCFSQVGYQGGYQILNLSGRHPAGRGCFRHGTVVHELLHTLGFYHMQSSPDRDDFIDVLWENIIEPARHNFRKYNWFAVSDFGVGYDYDSVLHYSRRAFSSNGKDTLVPKQNGATIGQRVGLSDKDTTKLNKMYCDAESDTQAADVDSAPKAGKKKNPKNKPFDGHGIGYHQGKTVVIKLLPTPETYKLLDLPSFHIFDYFSQTPKILSSSQTEKSLMDTDITYANPSRYRNKYLLPRNKNINTQTNRKSSVLEQAKEKDYMKLFTKNKTPKITENDKNKQSRNHKWAHDTSSNISKYLLNNSLNEDNNSHYKMRRYYGFPWLTSNVKFTFNDDEESGVNDKIVDVIDPSHRTALTDERKSDKSYEEIEFENLKQWGPSVNDILSKTNPSFNTVVHKKENGWLAKNVKKLDPFKYEPYFTIDAFNANKYRYDGRKEENLTKNRYKPYSLFDISFPLNEDRFEFNY